MNILLIEDDTEILAFLREAFRGEGFVVDTAGDGLVGSQKARMNDYDMIILDNCLPYKNGKDICAELRALQKNTRIIMLSVVEDLAHKVDLLDQGVDDYVTKPFMFSELLARVRAVLRRPDKLQGTVLTVGGFALDTISHTLKKHGKEIRLTPKEFSFLAYLMRNQGRILSRMSILEHVWGVDADPFTNTVETHIVNLRKKLGDHHKKSLIHTVPGVGYQICA